MTQNVGQRFRPVALLLLGVGVASALPTSGNQSDWSVDDGRRCQEDAWRDNISLSRLQVLPGFGWDNLRNLEAGLVVTYNFRQCKTTDDGNYLVPDEVNIVPLKSSLVENYAEFIEIPNSMKSSTSRSINLNAGLFFIGGSISGSFSAEYEQMKSTQNEFSSYTVRMQRQYLGYTAELQPDPELSPQFKSRLLRIAAHIELNQKEQADLEAQMLVRDFGTHVLTSVTAGMGLTKDDYLTRQFIEANSENRSAIQASAEASFLKFLSLGGSPNLNFDTSFDEKYKKSLRHTLVLTHGGPLVQSEQLDINKWMEGFQDNLVAMDRTGSPLYFMVNPRVLPDLPPLTVEELEKVVRRAVRLYYEMNIIPGCTNPASPNFGLSANVDDGSCKMIPTNQSFAGVYQSCSVVGRYLDTNPCNDLDFVNPKTGDYSCPSGYTSFKLHTAQSPGQTESHEKCERCYLFATCCDTEQFNSRAEYETYWCATTGQVPKNSGYLFGGHFTKTDNHPITQSRRCPLYFTAHKILSDLTVCLSDDFDQGSISNIPFGGFFTCKAGNPLAAKKDEQEWPQRCPDGYNQRLATTEAGCSVHSCIMANAVPSLVPIKRPPFMMASPTLIDSNGELVMIAMEKQDRVSIPVAYKFAQPQGDSRNSGAFTGISTLVILACFLMVKVTLTVC